MRLGILPADDANFIIPSPFPSAEVKTCRRIKRCGKFCFTGIKSWYQVQVSRLRGWFARSRSPTPGLRGWEGERITKAEHVPQDVDSSSDFLADLVTHQIPDFPFRSRNCIIFLIQIRLKPLSRPRRGKKILRLSEGRRSGRSDISESGGRGTSKGKPRKINEKSWKFRVDWKRIRWRYVKEDFPGSERQK